MTTAKVKQKRPALSGERIATEAMALVDEGGIDALSFRTLAARLRCQAMSLYHYYPSKQHLIDALGLSGAQDAYLLRSLAEQNGGEYVAR